MTDVTPYETYDHGVLIDSGTTTRQLAPPELDQQSIQQAIIAARTALGNATTQVNAATTTTAVAALQAYARANNQAWQALLPALRYISTQLAT